MSIMYLSSYLVLFFSLLFFFLMIRRPPRSTLFPYTSSSDLAQAVVQPPAEREVLVGVAAPEVEALGIGEHRWIAVRGREDRKSTRLNSSHMSISYAVFCLKKKKHNKSATTPTHQ